MSLSTGTVESSAAQWAAQRIVLVVCAPNLARMTSFAGLMVGCAVLVGKLGGRPDRSGPQGLAQRWEQARRLLRENGVTYNVYGAPEGPDRPWELDPIPLLLAESEWQVAGCRVGATRQAAEPDPGRSLRSAGIAS